MKRLATVFTWVALIYGIFLMMAVLEAILTNWTDPSQSLLIQATWNYPLASVVVLAIPLSILALAGAISIVQMTLESLSDRRLLRAHETRRQAHGN